MALDRRSRTELHALDPREAAIALGLSPRALQRKLSEEGTLFRAELTRARIAMAQRLPLDGDATASEVAYRIGFTSVRHFRALFCEATGETPMRWRATARRKVDAPNS